MVDGVWRALCIYAIAVFLAVFMIAGHAEPHSYGFSASGDAKFLEEPRSGFLDSVDGNAQLVCREGRRVPMRI